MSEGKKPVIKVWRTLKIGVKTRDELLAGLKALGYEFDVGFSETLNDGPETEIDLVRIRVSQVGQLADAVGCAWAVRHGGPAFQEVYGIWRVAEALGLELCPPSTAAYMALSGLDREEIGQEALRDELYVTASGPRPYMGASLYEHEGARRIWSFEQRRDSCIDWCDWVIFVLPRKGENGSSK